MSPTEVYTLSLHDALPIFLMRKRRSLAMNLDAVAEKAGVSTSTVSRVLNNLEIVKSSTRSRVLKVAEELDRKSTRLNSSHRCISYAVFCLKKKRRRRAPCE